jgi:hypothetical protein
MLPILTGQPAGTEFLGVETGPETRTKRTRAKVALDDPIHNREAESSGSDHATSSLSAGHRIRRRGFEDIVQPSATRPAIPRGPRYLRPSRRKQWNRLASRQWTFRGIVASYAHHPVKLALEGKKCREIAGVITTTTSMCILRPVSAPTRVGVPRMRLIAPNSAHPAPQ